MKRHVMYLCCGMMLAAAAYGPVRAEDADDVKLQAEAQRIDKDKPVTTDAQKEDALSKQFNVPTSAVADLRTKGQGWGEITIGLAEAQKVQQMDPKTYPTMTDALNKIETLRASGEGWGKIAKDLGFKLGPVISAAHRARHELNETAEMERAERDHHGELDEHERHHDDMTGHPDRPERPERPDRPGH